MHKLSTMRPLKQIGTIAALALLFAGAAGANSAQTRSKPSQGAEFKTLATKAAAARDAERLEEAAALYRKALRINPRWAEGWWTLGAIDYDADRYTEAALEFKKVIAQDPRHGTARAMLGLCQFRLGQDGEALRNIDAAKAIGIADDDQLQRVMLYDEGVLLQRAGRFEAARAALGSLCQSGAADQDAVMAMGMVALWMTDAQPPTDGQAANVTMHVGRGACLGSRKNFDAGRQEFELVATLAPHFRKFHLAYGRFLEDAGDSAGAIRQYKLEIEDDPSSILARFCIGAAEYKVDSAAGVPYAEEAVRLAPELPYAHYVLGLLLLDIGEFSRAVPELEIARKAFPGEARIELALGSAYAHVGRPEDAARSRAEFQRLTQAQRSENAAEGAHGTTGLLQSEINDGMDGAKKH
jgi:tetratricopeptide (TPR) repeat protein